MKKIRIQKSRVRRRRLKLIRHKVFGKKRKAK